MTLQECTISYIQTRGTVRLFDDLKFNTNKEDLLREEKPIAHRFTLSPTEYDQEGTLWVYNCGWYIMGNHPYRQEFLGFQFISDPIGILEFFRDINKWDVDIITINKEVKS